MKKAYTMPEIEIKAFSTEDIITASSTTTPAATGMSINKSDPVIDIGDIGTGNTINIP